jgi:hypothetical protein
MTQEKINEDIITSMMATNSNKELIERLKTILR